MKFIIISSFILIQSLALANDSVFDGTQPTTEAEKSQAEDYLHQGKTNAEYNEMCIKDGKVIDECIDTESAFQAGSTWQKIESMMPMVTQAYSLVGGITGQLNYVERKNGSPELTDGKNDISVNKNGQYTMTKDQQNTSALAKDNSLITDSNQNIILTDEQIKKGEFKEKTEKRADYCGYIPAVIETSSNFYQQMMDKKTEENIGSTQGTQSQQAASFYAMAKVQKDRSKVATVQAAGWGATSACYAALMATNTINGSVGTYAKTAASILLTTFYTLKIKGHKERAEILEAMAKKLPQAGDCNPITATTCFCNENTSQASDPVNFQKYCTPKGFIALSNDSFVCVDKENKVDAACDCKSKGTCISAKFATIGANIGLDSSVMNNPLKGISPLSSGFGVAGLQAITDKNLAFAKKTLKNIADVPDMKLTAKQKETAKELSNSGIPKFAAASFASSASTGKLPDSLTGSGYGSANTQDSSRLNKAFTSVSNPKFNSGSTLKGKSSGSSYKSPFGTFGKKKRTGGANKVEILSFAEQAQREAEITKDTSKPIFDIITYRYKTSAWREFQETIEKESKLIEEEKK